MTSFTAIYEVFLGKISDYKLAAMDLPDAEERMKQYLNAAIAQFSTNCKQDLSDRSESGFNFTLSEMEVQILTTWMVYEWLHSYIHTTELISQDFSPRDYKIYSQANHLHELRLLREDASREAKRLMKQYGFDYLKRTKKQ